MLAQYRCGRQADALDTYRRRANGSIEELGADPSPSLRQVHQQILDGDPGHTVANRAAPGRGSIRAPAAHLPRRATSFIGRDEYVSRAAAALREGPLVTLTGVGGVGKTRLALETAGQEKGRFGDGAWLCELAPLERRYGRRSRRRGALRLQQQQGLGIEATVIEYLRTRELLLVVDNCEHVLDAAARLLDQIVRHCPHGVGAGHQPGGARGSKASGYCRSRR